MDWNFLFFANSILLGIGLAMDAFSVSVVNGLNEPDMKQRKHLLIAGVFAFFQALMPMLGWLCIHSVVQYFDSFETLTPWIAMILLVFIGGKMIREGLSNEQNTKKTTSLSLTALLVQGIATSIDALSVGFAIATYNFTMALTASLLIAATTFFICFGGVSVGKRVGTLISGKASFLGGAILIAIGLEIWITGIF